MLDIPISLRAVWIQRVGVTNVYSLARYSVIAQSKISIWATDDFLLEPYIFIRNINCKGIEAILNPYIDAMLHFSDFQLQDDIIISHQATVYAKIFMVIRKKKM